MKLSTPRTGRSRRSTNWSLVHAAGDDRVRIWGAERARRDRYATLPRCRWKVSRRQIAGLAATPPAAALARASCGPRDVL
jgi:hypothetical protein